MTPAVPMTPKSRPAAGLGCDGGCGTLDCGCVAPTVIDHGAGLVHGVDHGEGVRLLPSPPLFVEATVDDGRLSCPPPVGELSRGQIGLRAAPGWYCRGRDGCDIGPSIESWAAVHANSHQPDALPSSDSPRSTDSFLPTVASFPKLSASPPRRPNMLYVTSEELHPDGLVQLRWMVDPTLSARSRFGLDGACGGGSSMAGRGELSASKLHHPHEPRWPTFPRAACKTHLFFIF